MTDGGDALEVEPDVQLGEQVDSGGDILEGLRPAAATRDPSVFEVPGGEPVAGEIEAELGQERAVVAGAPVPAVDDHDRRVRPVRGREEELAQLARVRSVAVD